MTNEMQPKPKWPTWKQAVILLGAGIVLSEGGCATFLVGYKGGGVPSMLMFIGALAFFEGVILLIAGALRVGLFVQTWKQPLILLAAGAVLATCGWCGVLAAVQWRTAPKWVLFIAWPASVVGVVLLLVTLVGVMTLSRKKRAIGIKAKR